MLQNHEAFEFFDCLVAAGNVTFETAGALGNGQRVWVVVKVDGEIVVKGDDRVEKYLLLSTGHDGSTAVQIRFTPVRVVCQNTLLWSLSTGTDLFKIYHTSGMRKAVSDAKDAVQKIFDGYRDLERAYKGMAEKRLSEKDLEGYLSAVYPDPGRRKDQSQAAHDRALAKARRLRSAAAKLFEDGRGNNQPGIRHTLWAAYNGVVELVDHRSDYANPGIRMTATCFGNGERVKQLAFSKAIEMLSTSS